MSDICQIDTENIDIHKTDTPPVPQSLADLDFNLLKTLHVLLSEQQVTRAAQTLGRSQPAVSNALHRLREALDDDLLVRGAGGFTLTPRAEALKAPLREVMAIVETSVLKTTDFDPRSATDVLRISAPDRLTLAVVPSLAARLQRFAPKMSLDVTTADRSQALAMLNDERIDLLLGWSEDLPSHLKGELLYREPLLCVMRRGHPLAKARRRLSIDAVLSFPHVVVSATGGRTQIFDDLLATLGLRRRALVTVSNFTAIPRLLQDGDMVGVFTKLAARALVSSFGLEMRAIPAELGTVATHMVWQLRNDRNSAHVWLREQVRAVYRRLSRGA
ncbi:LysR family transcriptional regulator [Pseudolabrys taiwanensis]|uniref:LysR family transcriptional regulator n=1 Tax=Pseudolabrys taiwanensis TaxID=331696 RepID=A0A345ZSQ3_9HYPH|nr:LysR family transcriptional regulator [Pseudolabrys taiwanensis]